MVRREQGTDKDNMSDKSEPRINLTDLQFSSCLLSDSRFELQVSNLPMFDLGTWITIKRNEDVIFYGRVVHSTPTQLELSTYFPAANRSVLALLTDGWGIASSDVQARIKELKIQ